MMGGPFSWLYSINYMVFAVGQFIEVIKMNSQHFVNMYNQLSRTIRLYCQYVFNSKFRKWLQTKSKQNKILRFLFILSSIAIASQTARLLRLLVSIYNQQQQQNNNQIAGCPSLGSQLLNAFSPQTTGSSSLFSNSNSGRSSLLPSSSSSSASSMASSI